MKNITMSANEAVLEQARVRARAEHRTLNELFRQWLERYVAQPGAAILAAKTGRPVIPILAFAKRRKKFDSWDRFELPYPFSEITVLFGEPIRHDKSAEVEETRARIEAALRAMVVEGEALYDREADF